MTTHHLERIAPVHMHNPSSSSTSSMQQFTVGKLDAGMAILLGTRASLIEFPSLLLPSDVTSGSVVEITVKRNLDQERQNQRDFDQLQQDILDTFGKAGPAPPQLRLRAVTQTSVVLEWSALDLATATLLSLDIYRNGSRLAPIPSPHTNASTKLSGLDVGAEYVFHLVLKTTAGTFTSNSIRTKTHTMSDTSGISVCFGAVDGEPAAQPGEEGPVAQLEALTRDLLVQMGAKVSTKLQIDTTHYVCTSPRARYSGAPGGASQAGSGAAGGVNAAGEGPTYRKALQLNIPVVRPEWIVACWEAKKMVPISAYYIDQDPPNHASVQSLLGKQSAAQQSSAAAAAAPSAVAAPAAEGRDTNQAQEEAIAEEAPPPPAPKDNAAVSDASTEPQEVALARAEDTTSTSALEQGDSAVPASDVSGSAAGGILDSIEGDDNAADKAKAEAAPTDVTVAPSSAPASAERATQPSRDETAVGAASTPSVPGITESMEDISLSGTGAGATTGLSESSKARQTSDHGDAETETEEVDLS